jgi:hypothetical protein
MAHFFVPAGVERRGYDVDNRLAPGSVWRMQIPEKSRRKIGLSGVVDGMDWISNNPSVISTNDAYIEDVGRERHLSLLGENVGTSLIHLAVRGVIWATLQVQVVPQPAGREHWFIVRDVRLAGYRPNGDVIEVTGDTPFRYVIDMIIDRGRTRNGNVRAIFMAHGLPGFIQCANGRMPHPTAGPGIGITDLDQFSRLKGYIKQITFYSCLVARIGTCFECGGDEGYDGNAFCYRLAKATNARVKASIHLQYYDEGAANYSFKRPNGQAIQFGHWNGTVFTWGPDGSIIRTEQWPYIDLPDRPAEEID